MYRDQEPCVVVNFVTDENAQSDDCGRPAIREGEKPASRDQSGKEDEKDLDSVESDVAQTKCEETIEKEPFS